MINKSATKVGSIKFIETGKINTIWIGSNRNTGTTIVWQKLYGPRPTRLTGKNIGKMAAELNEVLNNGEAVWIEGPNADALEALKQHMKP